jgi:glutamine cyclotransferase
MYESIGLYGESAVRKLDLRGNVLKEHKLHKQYFAEGLDVFNNQLIQLTWMEKAIFYYDVDTLDPIKMVAQPETETGQAWGITNDGTHLIVSDGSSNLYFWDPETLQEVRRVQVRNKTLAKEFKPLYKRLGHTVGMKPGGGACAFFERA